MNIVLTGFMASGKTEISKAIKAESNYKLIDTDDMIVKETNKSINEIFTQAGEEKFRSIEHEIIKKVAQLDGYVISTGGGVPLNLDSICELRKNGIIVNLEPSFEVIEERLENARATRPLLQNQNIEEIKKQFEYRKKFYADCDFKINIIKGRTPRSYALEILHMVTIKSH